MTTIILVAIGVLIAAVAALMIIFYGGDAFSDSESRTQAARLLQEASQLEYAFDFFYRQEGRLPGNGVSGEAAIADLKSHKYLTQMPQGMQADNGDHWNISYEDGMILTRVGASQDERALKICVEARRQMKMADPEHVYKCDGSDHPGGKLSSRDPCCIKS